MQRRKGFPMVERQRGLFQQEGAELRFLNLARAWAQRRSANTLGGTRFWRCNKSRAG